MENLLFLGVPILKHIRVHVICFILGSRDKKVGESNCENHMSVHVVLKTIQNKCSYFHSDQDNY